MLRGTRLLLGEQATCLGDMAGRLRRALLGEGFIELAVPAIWGQSTFLDKLGSEKEGQMWTFCDKGGRACCLVPEITAIVQETWRNEWERRFGGLRLFYITRCYRYDRPQAGRYREFTQVGVEYLGKAADGALPQALDVLARTAGAECPGLVLNASVARGIGYYTGRRGFELEAPWLGAQKQVAGGGAYAEGLGTGPGTPGVGGGNHPRRWCGGRNAGRCVRLAVGCTRGGASAKCGSMVDRADGG